jgi:hypothetical protein
MTVNRMFLRGIAASFCLCLTGSLAFGASDRTWVSGMGDNANTAVNCSRAKPCATFTAALSVTNAGGEIDVLDPGSFGAVIITQSVSIVADGVLGGVLQNTSGFDGIVVNTVSTDVVVLRGLTIEGAGSGSNGISFNDSGALHIENCTINRFSGNGILIDPNGNSQIFIKDTIVRNNAATGIDFFPSGTATVTAHLDDTTVRNNGALGIFFAPGGSSTVTASLDSVRLEGNSAALKAGDGTNVSVQNSVVAGNGGGLETSSSGSGRGVVINVESSIVSGNSFGGIVSVGANSTINISNVTVVKNGTGLATSGGQIVSFGNNKITNNTTNGSPTKTIAQK